MYIGIQDDGVYTNLGLLLRIMGAYAGTGKEPKIETSDNAFKIILPNLNVYAEQEGPDAAPLKNGEEESVIALAKERGTFTRKDVEKALGISQTTCGRLLKRMIGNGQIVQEGKSKNTHYRLSK